MRRQIPQLTANENLYPEITYQNAYKLRRKDSSAEDEAKDLIRNITKGINPNS